MEEVKVEWRGTWGVGDFMMALNCVYVHAWRTGKRINLEMHWPHDEHHLHHFEEEETIIERMEYIHSFYHQKDIVRLTHKFNQREGSPYFYSNTSMAQDKRRFSFGDGAYNSKKGDPFPNNDWLFSRYMIESKVYKDYYNGRKVVVWRPFFNAEVPRTWKRLLTNDGWDDIITKLRQAGLHVVELTYRTPVREAMFHILTAKFTLSYCGMWHYISKNALTPMIVVSEEGVSKMHTGRNGLVLSHDKRKNTNIWKALDELRPTLNLIKRIVSSNAALFEPYLLWKSLQDYAKKYRDLKE